ncbi:MAG: hypothetical protein JWL96_3739 [Sphingomonas bacterium]|uniref:hypothetical protein n=1 Tax=Sphingomonas bacterium TaxID=1895847 RepID=UPI002608B6AC|nr:hypothetical protein [Sphingomonas bacterium]MDB5711669.1 hypothetical protein [Sphingomonas bacterium]
MNAAENDGPAVIVDPGIAAALIAGQKTQKRVGASSAVSRCVAGDRIRVRESCLAARHEAGQDIVTTPARAEFAIFWDGWRQYRDGSGKPGRPPGKADYKWIAAAHMPRWASRITLVVERVRQERLQQITRRDIRAEGVRPVLGGLLWRWPRPIPGMYRGARRAFAANWNVNHPAAGERWDDDPIVSVIDFHVEPGPVEPIATRALRFAQSI